MSMSESLRLTEEQGHASNGTRDGARARLASRSGIWRLKLPLVEPTAKLLIARREVARAAREGRLRPGLPIADAVSPVEIPSVARLGTADRVLADVDQDGFLFARDPADAEFFNRRTEMLPRKRYQLHVVLRGGAVCLRKRFVRRTFRRGIAPVVWSVLGLPFYTSVAAALRLAELPCGGSVREFDLRTRTIHWDLVHGEDLRHWLGHSGALVHDLDLNRDPALRELDSDSRDLREIELFNSAGGSRFWPPVRDEVMAMNAAGVAILDVKLGNILAGEKTGLLYWVDFESAYLASWPRWEAAVRLQDRLLERWFAGAGQIAHAT